MEQGGGGQGDVGARGGFIWYRFSDVKFLVINPPKGGLYCYCKPKFSSVFFFFFFFFFLKNVNCCHFQTTQVITMKLHQQLGGPEMLQWAKYEGILPDFHEVIHEKQKNSCPTVWRKLSVGFSWEFFYRYLEEGSSAERSLIKIPPVNPEIFRI